MRATVGTGRGGGTNDGRPGIDGGAEGMASGISVRSPPLKGRSTEPAHQGSLESAGAAGRTRSGAAPAGPRGRLQGPREALEVGRARCEVVGGGDVDEIVDAPVLLHDVDVVLHGHAIELCPHHRVHRLAPVEGDDLLGVERALRRPHDEVLGERGEGGVVVALPAADVEERRALAPVVTEGEVGAFDVDATPAARDGAHLDAQVVLGEHVVGEARRGVRARREAGPPRHGHDDERAATHVAVMDTTRVQIRLDLR